MRISSKKLKVGIVNLADVRNYGDVLFPLIIGHEISQRLPNSEIKYISATGSKWVPTPNSFRFDQVNLDDFDLLILGGGCVVHRNDEMLRVIYSRFNEQFVPKPTDLVFTFANSKAKYKAWLSLGVPIYSNFSALDPRSDIKQSIQNLDFIGFRGSNSLSRVKELNIDKAHVRFTPDLGWLFPRLLGVHRDSLNEESLQTPDLPSGAFMVIQTIWGIPNGEIEQICKWTVERNIQIVLLPLTRCWQDDSSLKKFQDHANYLGYNHILSVDTNLTDVVKLRILSKCIMYVGESLHGFVSAASFGIPAGVVAKTQLDKFDEIMKDNSLEQYKIESWKGIIGLFEKLSIFNPILLTKTTRKHSQNLDRQFDRICLGATGAHHLPVKVLIRNLLH